MVTEGFLFPRQGARILEAQTFARKRKKSKASVRHQISRLGKDIATAQATTPAPEILQGMGPGAGRFGFILAQLLRRGATAAGVRAPSGLGGAAAPGTALATQGPGALSRVGVPLAVAGAGGVAFQSGVNLLQGGAGEPVGQVAGRAFEAIRGGKGMALPGMGKGGRGVGVGGFQVGAQLPPSHQIVKVWSTGTATFAKMADGHHAVQKKDGTIKHFRPYRPVVVPRKWNARSMRRVASALKRQQKTAIGIVKLAGGEASAGRRARK